MTSLNCIIPDCINPAKEGAKRMSDERIKSVAHSSIKRAKTFDKRLKSLKAESVILTQKLCLLLYTSQHHIDRYVRKRKQVEEKNNSVEKEIRQSNCPIFNFRKYCLFCGKKCKNINPRNAGR